jgi:hypothetical protein
VKNDDLDELLASVGPELVVATLAHTIRQASRWLSVAHRIVGHLDLETPFFIDTAIVLADYAHDLDIANQTGDDK